MTTKFTPESRARMLFGLRTGQLISTSCEYARITPATFYQWMMRGEEASLKDEDQLTPDELDYLIFWEAATEARTVAEMEAVIAIRAGFTEGKDWKAADKYLTKLHPEKYSDKITVDVSNQDAQILALMESMKELGESDDIVDADIVETDPKELESGDD